MFSSLKIALSMRVVDAHGYEEYRDALAQDWFNLFNEWEITPICIPNVIKNIEPLVSMADMVILTGGDDIALDFNNNIINNIEKHKKQRDIQEYRIIDACIKNNIPVLGVCRGMQLINYRFGGTLRALDPQKHVCKEHKINIIEGDFIKKRISVNSYHNNGVFMDTLGKDLKILAVSEDSSIEAISHTKYPILGIMWHPERSVPFSKEDKEMLLNFIQNSLGEEND